MHGPHLTPPMPHPKGTGPASKHHCMGLIYHSATITVWIKIVMPVSF